MVTLPVLRALAAAGGAVVAAPRARAQLLSHLVPGLDWADLESPALSRLASAPDRADAPWRSALAEAERVVGFAGPSPPWRGAVERLAPRARCHWLELRPPADWPGHVMDWHRRQLEAAGADLAPRSGPVPPVGEGPVTLHPGSGGTFKEWPVARFRALAEGLRRRGLPVEEVVGEAEIERGKAEALTAWAEPVWDPPLPELADRLRACRAFVGNDAGPSHLAAAVGAPTLALFGPTSPTQWRPRGPRVEVIAPETPAEMAWLPVERVLEAVLRMTQGDEGPYIAPEEGHEEQP